MYVFYNEKKDPSLSYAKIIALGSSIKYVLRILLVPILLNFGFVTSFQSLFTGVHHTIRFRNTWAIKCTLVLLKLTWNEDFQWKCTAHVNSFMHAACMSPELTCYIHVGDMYV